MSLSSSFSSLVGTLYADAPEEQKVPDAESQADAPANAEEEPEDVRLLLFLQLLPFVPELHLLNAQIHPKLREEAQESSKCKATAQHYFHCQEKVQSGKGFKHEDCVEEM
jgi:ubiquinol-cytochrome c reductase subunit 6